MNLKKSKGMLHQKHPESSHELLLALSRAAQSIQKAHTAEDFYFAVGDELKAIGGEVALLLVNEDSSSLSIAYTSYSAKLIGMAEKITGLSSRNYQIPFSQNTTYGQVMSGKKSIFVDTTNKIIEEIIPESVHTLIKPIISLFELHQGILAPLRVDDQVLGLLKFNGSFLNEDDVLAIDSFAGQVAAGLQNIHLMQKLRDELHARKQAEETLQISKSTYEGIFNSITEAIYIQDGNGVFLDVNLSAQTLYGYPKEHFIGQTIESFSAPQKNNLDLISNYIKEAFNGKTVEFEFWGIKKDGTIFPKDIRMSPGIYFGRKVVIAVGRDISKNKKAEEALLISEERYKVLYEDNPSMYFTTDEDGIVLSASKYCMEQLGYKHEELIGQPVVNVFHPADQTMFTESFKQCIKNPKLTFQLEARKIKNDGTTIWVRESSCAVYNPQRQLVVLLTCNDITDRRKAEDALRASEENFKSLYQVIKLMSDNMPDLVWAKDMEGRYIFANKAMTQKLLIAKDTEEPIGKTDMFFAERQRSLHKERSDWHTFGELCMDSDRVIHSSQQAERFDEFGNVQGQFLFLDVYKAPFWDEKGTMIGTVGIGRDVTQEKILLELNKQTQEALATSEAELRGLFAAMQDSVLVIDRRGVYQKIAPTQSKLYLNPSEVIGKHLSYFFSVSQAQIFLDLINQVLETRQTAQIEYQLFVDGHAPWFEASVSPMDSDRTIWVARDISERKQVEAKLHLQSAALEAAANTIVITDREGLIQWVNSSFTTLTGYHQDEALGKNPRDLINSGKQDKLFYKKLWDTILGGNMWHGELLNRRKDDSIYAEEMTITPLQNLDGEISHFIAVKQDISERKKVEASLIKSEKEYRMLFENMPIGLYRTSIDGKILDANSALVHMFGYPDRETLLNMKTSEFYVNPGTEIKFQEEIRSKNILSGFEAQFYRWDKSTFWAEDYVHIVNDQTGNPLFYEGSLIDITERKQAEDELRYAKGSLESAHLELQEMLAHEQILARTDGLTNLYNRRYFFELAVREFNASIRYFRPLTVILFDVDSFKQTNDTYGHAAGDVILAYISRAAASQVRDVDVIARYGGDEFIVLLPETTAQMAFIIAERIRQNVAAKVVDAGTHQLAPTISMGIAEISFSPQDTSIEDTIRRADSALYLGKKNGRNNVTTYKEIY